MPFQRGCGTGWACLYGERRVRKMEFDTWKWEARDTIWRGVGGSLRQEVQPISYKQSGVNPELRTSTGRSQCDGCPGVRESESRSVVSDSLRPHTVHGTLQAGVGSHSLLQGNLPNPGIEPWSPTLQVDSLPAEPPEKPQNIGVGSLSHLQQIFLTQESNQGLLHCRRILYQLSYQGSPTESMVPSKPGGVRQMSKVKAAKAKVGGQTRLEGQGSRISRGEAGEGQWESTERSPSTSRQSPPACGAPYQC